MDENLSRLTDEFVAQRLSYWGQNETEVVSDSVLILHDDCGCLHDAISEEHRQLLQTVKDAFNKTTEEQNRFYYEAGYADAIGFLMGWKER